MSSFVGLVIGAIAITLGVLIEVGSFGTATPFFIAIAGALLTAGTGQVLSGIGTLISGSGQQGGQQGGVAFASRNPIKSWDSILGHCVEGGKIASAPESRSGL